MRIIGEIEHPSMKISVFKVSDRLSIKFEKMLLEQIYKFRDGSGIDTLENVTHLVSPTLLTEVEAQFEIMARIRRKGIESMISDSDDDDDFPVIM
jgi:hypothetical protein